MSQTYTKNDIYDETIHALQQAVTVVERMKAGTPDAPMPQSNKNEVGELLAIVLGRCGVKQPWE